METVNILGLDIGGANTKAALIKFKLSRIFESLSIIEYFPFWEKTLNEIPNMFERIVENLINQNNSILDDINYIAITITAELSDAFQTKQEGIFIILNALDQVFEKGKMFFVNNKKEFINFNKAKNDPISVAAANWVSTSLYLVISAVLTTTFTPRPKFSISCLVAFNSSRVLEVSPTFAPSLAIAIAAAALALKKRRK